MEFDENDRWDLNRSLVLVGIKKQYPVFCQLTEQKAEAINIWKQTIMTKLGVATVEKITKRLPNQYKDPTLKKWSEEHI